MKLPTEFRGCMWNDGWEFDAPNVLYYPIKRYQIGGNSGEIDGMVEDHCFLLDEDYEHLKTGFSDGDLKEFKWRHWSPRGFSRRKKAWHVKIFVKWTDGKFEITGREEQWGPFTK